MRQQVETQERERVAERKGRVQTEVNTLKREAWTHVRMMMVMMMMISLLMFYILQWNTTSSILNGQELKWFVDGIKSAIRQLEEGIEHIEH